MKTVFSTDAPEPGYLSLLTAIAEQARNDMYCDGHWGETRKGRDVKKCAPKKMYPTCDDCKKSARMFLNPDTSPMIATGLALLEFTKERVDRPAKECYSYEQVDNEEQDTWTIEGG